jgi:hypothetical protein
MNTAIQYCTNETCPQLGPNYLGLVAIIGLVLLILFGLYYHIDNFFKRKKKGKEERNLPLKNRR